MGEAPGWAKIMLIIGLSCAMLGLIISTLAPVNFVEEGDDYDDPVDYAQALQDEQDFARFQYLLGAIFIHIGVGLALFTVFIGYALNPDVSTNTRMIAMIIMISAFVIWFVFEAIANALAALAVVSP